MMWPPQSFQNYGAECSVLLKVPDLGLPPL